SATAMWVKTSRVLLGTALLGGPNFLSEENIRRIASRPDEHYRQRELRGTATGSGRAGSWELGAGSQLTWELSGAGIESLGQGRGMAFGYLLPGGFSQYALVGREVLFGDEGCYLLPVDPGLGYAEAALCEPWACVEAAYRYEPRRGLLRGGAAWFFAADAEEA